MKALVAVLIGASLFVPVQAQANDECAGAHGNNYPCLYENDNLPANHQIDNGTCFNAHWDTAGYIVLKGSSDNKDNGNTDSNFNGSLVLHNGSQSICPPGVGHWVYKWKASDSLSSNYFPGIVGIDVYVQ